MELKEYPIDGKFGKYGGQFVPETLMLAVKELENAYIEAKNDPSFQNKLNYYLSEYSNPRRCLKKRFTFTFKF